MNTKYKSRSKGLLLTTIIILLSLITLESRSETNEYLKPINQPTITKEQLKAVLKTVGFKKHTINTMLCIAEKESNFDQMAVHRNRNKTVDYGLFQINSIHLKFCDTTTDELFNIQDNAKCALKVHKKQGFKAWYAYRKFKKYCSNYKG